MAGLIKRNGIWHLRMRVPRRYEILWTREGRRPKSEIHRSLKTGDERTARARAAVVEQQILSDFDFRLLDHGAPSSQSHYEAIAALSNSRGFTYKTAHEIAAGDLGDLLRRVEDLMSKQDAPGSPGAKALLGASDRPRPSLTEVAASMADWFPLEVRDKTARQQDTWSKRWTRPAQKLVSTLGGLDPVFEDITRVNAVALRDELMDRVSEGDFKGSSAQKELQNLNLLWKKYFQKLGFDELEAPPSPFRGLGDGLGRLDDDSRKNEVPKEILETLVQPGAMSNMNDELRDLVLVLIETGCRQAEVTDIAPEHIMLDADIPHIRLRKQSGEFARELKNKASARDVPLVGVALDAMRRHPDGFPRYRAKGTFSASANKSLREAGILPEGITIGGLRHSFETRLKQVGVEADDRGELMGHSVKRIRRRQHYGDAMPLEERMRYHQRISICLRNL